MCACVWDGMGSRHKGRGGKMPETDDFQGHRVHRGGGESLGKQGHRNSHAVQEVSVLLLSLPELSGG